MLSALCVSLVTFIGRALSRSSTIEWLSDSDYNSFRSSFFNLDYNDDGVVTLNEAKLGILSILDAQYLQTQVVNERGEFSESVYAQYVTYRPSKYNCIPSLISMDFVDCLVMSVRHSTTAIEDATIDFDNVLALYFTDCDDVSPDDSQSCSSLVRQNGDICTAFEDGPSAHCELSCFRCNNGGRMLFAVRSDDGDDFAAYEDLIAYRMKGRSEIVALSGPHNKRILERKANLQTASAAGGAAGAAAADVAAAKPQSELMAMNQLNAMNSNGGISSSISNSIAINSNSNGVDHIGPLGKGHALKKSKNKLHRQEQQHLCPVPAKLKHVNRDRFVFMSDVHVEPWYDIDSTENIARFEGFSVENMFSCRNAQSALLEEDECLLTGFSDPPISFFSSALTAWNMYSRRPEDSVLFFVGDAQGHHYLDEGEAVESLMYSLIDSMLYYFEPDGIFLTAGNNDGPHNAAFTNRDARGLTASWSRAIVETGIVNNVQMPQHRYSIHGEDFDTVSLFLATGYYMKPLIKIAANHFVVVVNTNLGSLNPTQQMALEHDLEFVAQLGGRVAVLGHHPSVLENMVPPQYVTGEDNDIVLGLFSGHIHYFSPTNKRGFTTLPAMTQFAPYSAFAMGDIQDVVQSEDGAAKQRLRLSNENLLMYIGDAGQAVDSHCWQ